MTEGEFFRSVVPDDAVSEHDFDTSVAHPARIWNVLLGGKDNFAADRAAAEALLAASPVVAEVAKADRAFLASVVNYLATEVGIREFLDIGTGLPTANNTHEVAQRARPGVPHRLRRQRSDRADPRAGPADQRSARRHRLHRGRSAGDP